MLHFHLPFQTAKGIAHACSGLCHLFEPPLNIDPGGSRHRRGDATVSAAFILPGSCVLSLTITVNVCLGGFNISFFTVFFPHSQTVRDSFS